MMLPRNATNFPPPGREPRPNHMSKNRILTKKIAEKFLLEKLDSADSFTHLEDAAAEILARHEGSLWLSNLTSLSDAAAKALSKHKGGIDLSMVATLSQAAATSLAKIQGVPGEGAFLQFGSLTLTPEIAGILAKFGGDLVSFKVSAISFGVARAFRGFKGRLALGNVTTLDDETAAELARRKIPPYLDGLRCVRDTPGHMALAACLAGLDAEQDFLPLSSLIEVGPRASEVLCRYRGCTLSVNPKILQALRKLRLQFAQNAANEEALPQEWQNGRVVLGKPPAHPLKGHQAQRINPRSASSWWLPASVPKWFIDRLEDRHKTKAHGESPSLSPEAAGLLRQHAEAWYRLSQAESRSTTDLQDTKLQSLANLPVPPEFSSGKVLLPPPKMTLSKAYQWKADFEGEDYRAVLHYHKYLPSRHVGTITDPNGYPAKSMSPEAADLYRRHRAFWEAKFLESGSQAKVASQKRQQLVQKQISQGAASSGLSHKELEAKLTLLANQSTQGKLNRAAETIAGFVDAGLYLALLAGSSISKEGDLKPGKALKRFGEHGTLIMLVALAHMPEGLQLDPSLCRGARMNVGVSEENLSIVVEMLVPKLPNLRPDSIVSLDIPILSVPMAQFLTKIENGDFEFGRLKILDAQVAAVLARTNAYLNLGIPSISDEAAKAFINHKGALIINEIKTLSDSAAKSLADKDGDLSICLKALPASTANMLARHKGGTLSFPSLVTISPEAAQALSSHSAELVLGEKFGCYSSFTLEPDAAEHLSRHGGNLTINGLKNLTDKAAMALSQLKYALTLEELRDLPTGPGGVALCKKLCDSSIKELSFLYLRSLSRNCAAALALGKGALAISLEETKWSDDVLLALAAHRGSLTIDPRHLSDASGRALGQRSAKTALTLRYLKSLTDVAAKALSVYGGMLSMESDNKITMSPEAARLLTKRNSLPGILKSHLNHAARKVFDANGRWDEQTSTWTRAT